MVTKAEGGFRIGLELRVSQLLRHGVTSSLAEISAIFLTRPADNNINPVTKINMFRIRLERLLCLSNDFPLRHLHLRCRELTKKYGCLQEQCACLEFAF